MYFIYKKDTLEYAGVQEQSVDTDTLGCTTIPVPNLWDDNGIEIVYKARWTGTEWELIQQENDMPMGKGQRGGKKKKKKGSKRG